jgi:hypothetical protein
MRRRARAVPLARKNLQNLRLELRAQQPADWPKHLRMAGQVLRDNLAMSEEDSWRLVIESVSSAHTCARRVDERSRTVAQAQSIINLSKAFARIANCAKRGSAKLRQELDQAMIVLLRQTPVDLEVMEAIFDAAKTSFAKYCEEEPAKTALAALGTLVEDGVHRSALKVEFESLPSASHLRMETALSELATSVGGDLTAVQVLRKMASMFKAKVVNADPEIATLIVDYVAVVADLWRAAGLRPGRARKDADPKYRSHFHRFVELVLTAIIDPWSRRHDDDVEKHARALFRAHSELRGDYKKIGKGLRRSDVEWLVSEDHIRRALGKSAQKSAPETP